MISNKLPFANILMLRMTMVAGGGFYYLISTAEAANGIFAYLLLHLRRLVQLAHRR
jgi:hypothetical protein